MKRVVLLVALVLGFAAIVIAPAGQASGETINVLSVEGLAVPFLKWGPAWEEETGIKVNVIEAPYVALYSKVMTDLITGSGRYDLMHLPGGWAGDLMGGERLIPLEEYMTKYGFPDWDDVVPSVQTISKWMGKIYSIPIDGDCHTTYYRRDLLNNPDYQSKFEKKYGYKYSIPPKTWDEVMDVADFFTGWDWDGDGKDEYGLVFIGQRANQAPWFVIDIAAQYNVLPSEKPDKYRGIAFFDPETMEPLVNSPGWVEALKVYKKLAKYAPPGVSNYGFNEMRMAFVTGEAAMTFDWGDTGVMAQLPEEYGSVVKGKLGVGPLPGASKVWDRENGKWLEQHNQVPFLAFGGWILTIPKTAKNPDAAYKFATYVSDPKRSIRDVCGLHGFTGSNPYRESHREQIDMWVKGGWDKEDALEYLDATWDAYTSPIALHDLRIPGTQMYREDYIDLARAKVLAGEATAEEACQELYENWNRVTDTYDRETQRLLYRLSLGLPVE